MYSGTTFYFVQKSFLMLVALEVQAFQNHVQFVLRVFYNTIFGAKQNGTNNPNNINSLWSQHAILILMSVQKIEHKQT